MARDREYSHWGFSWLMPDKKDPMYHHKVGMRSLCIMIVFAALALSIVLVSPYGSVFDPLACTTALYVVGLFSVQTCVCDFSKADKIHVTLIVSAFTAFMLPTFLNGFSIWCGHYRVMSMFWDFLVCLATYKYMVNGLYTPPAPGSLAGRVCVVTGSNTGIGYEVAEALARAGGKVIFACRNEERARLAMKRLLGRVRGLKEEQLLFLKLDTSSLKSVRSFAEAFKQRGLDLHLLVLNAGVVLTRRDLSEDGLDLAFATNYFGHFLLVNLLWQTLLETEKKGVVPRIVQCTSSFTSVVGTLDFENLVKVNTEEERQAFLAKPLDTINHYGQSKMAGLLFQSELCRRLKKAGSKIPVNSVNPGECLTDIQRHMHWLIIITHAFGHRLAVAFMKTARQGSFFLVHACTSPEMATSGGISDELLYHGRPVACDGSLWRDEALASKLWQVSRELTHAPEL